MDDFVREQCKEIFQGGYKCKCCSDIGGHRKAIKKQQLHKRARTRLRDKLVIYIKNPEELI